MCLCPLQGVGILSAAIVSIVTLSCFHHSIVTYGAQSLHCEWQPAVFTAKRGIVWLPDTLRLASCMVTCDVKAGCLPSLPVAQASINHALVADECPPAWLSSNIDQGASTPG